jgi:hypothetical protein
MDIITTTKTIKMHTLRIDDSEIERYMNDHDAWIDVLTQLLTAKAPETHRMNGKKAPTKLRYKTSGPGIELIDCPKCGMQVKERGLLIHQRGSKCRVAQYKTPE